MPGRSGGVPRAADLLVILAAVASGCVGEGAPLDASDRRDPGAGTGPMRVVSVVDPGEGRGEPSLGVAPDGTLFTNTRAGAYRSIDGGHTWEHLGDPTDPFPDFDPDLAVDADGTVWVDTLYLACNVVAVSRDSGGSWTRHPAVCNGPVGDRQYVIPTEGGEAFLYYHQIPSFHQTAMRTTDHGLTWHPTGPMEPPDHHLLLTGGSGWSGGGFWDRAGDSVWATYTWFDAPQTREGNPRGESAWAPAASVTRDDVTWQVVRGPEPGGRSVGLGLVVGAADEVGNVYLAWAEARDGADGNDDMAVVLAASTDGGASWRGPFRVDDGTGSHVLPAIAAGPAGKVAIAYYEANLDGHPNGVPRETTWNVTIASTGDALADEPTWRHLQASPDTVKTGRLCPSGGSCDGDREFLDYFRIARLPDGRVGVVYNQMAGEDLLNVFGMTEDALLA